MKNWIHEHDERWSFVWPYVILSVALSVFVSLFWLAALIIGHVCLEWVRYKCKPPGQRFIHSLASTQLDWALLLAAVCMEVYLDIAGGLAGAGQFTRGVARVLGRIPGWQNALRAVLLSTDDALQLLLRNPARISLRGSLNQGKHHEENDHFSKLWA